MEKVIAEDDTDERAKRSRERLDHYLAQRVEEGDDKRESAEDPRPGIDPQTPQDERRVDVREEKRDGPDEHYIGSPIKNDDFDEDMGDKEEELDDGPNSTSERRVKSPVRAPAVKRRREVHIDEPDTKKIILGELTDEDVGDVDLDSIRAKKEDMNIVSNAILGRSL